jgi:hypothetical protein
MTITELISEARQDLLGDTVADYLWSDAQLTRFANEAILEACERAPLITRTNTISVVAGTAEYTLNEFTRQIYTAKLDLATSPLYQATESDLALYYTSQWRTKNNTPTHYVRTGNKIRLYPNPIVNDNLVIVAKSIPDDDFDLETDIDPAYHKDLLYYIAYKAYMYPDADSIATAKADEYLAKFTARFGPRKSAKWDKVSQNHVMYGGWIGGRMA